MYITKSEAMNRLKNQEKSIEHVLTFDERPNRANGLKFESSLILHEFISLWSNQLLHIFKILVKLFHSCNLTLTHD